MSGPKSSRYTLTAAQRRALAEQLERERQLRIQAERDERQRNENFSLYSDAYRHRFYDRQYSATRLSPVVRYD